MNKRIRFASGDGDTLRIIVQQRSLVKLLAMVAKTEGSSTRKLLRRLGANNYHSILKEAEREGFVTRNSVKPEGKGNHLKCSYLTGKGRAVVRRAKELGVL